MHLICSLHFQRPNLTYLLLVKFIFQTVFYVIIIQKLNCFMYHFLLKLCEDLLKISFSKSLKPDKNFAIPHMILSFIHFLFKSYYLNFTFLLFSISIFLILFTFKLLTFAVALFVSCLYPFGMPFLLISRLVARISSGLGPVSLIIVRKV